MSDLKIIWDDDLTQGDIEFKDEDFINEIQKYNEKLELQIVRMDTRWFYGKLQFKKKFIRRKSFI